MGSFHGLKWKKVTTTYHVGLVMVTVAKINLVFFAIGFIPSQTKTETSTNAYSQTS